MANITPSPPSLCSYNNLVQGKGEHEHGLSRTQEARVELPRPIDGQAGQENTETRTAEYQSALGRKAILTRYTTVYRGATLSQKDTLYESSAMGSQWPSAA